jgi:peptidoglycan/LPS O-acetylase OafA/YrhL
LLAICVLCAHSRRIGNFDWISGHLAVELFFVVSGFYMQLVLSSKYTRQRLGKSWATQFYKARYFRLFPTYAMGCALVVGAALLLRGLQPLPTWSYLAALPHTPGNDLFRAFLGFTNVTMIFQDVTMFFAVHGGAIHWTVNLWNTDHLLYPGLIIPQAWSLGIELSFYLIAPYLLRMRSSWLVGLAVLGLAAKMTFLRKFHLEDPFGYRFFPFELGYFVAGALAYRHRAKLDWIIPKKFGKAILYVFVTLFVLVQVPVHLPTLAYPLTLALLLPAMFRTCATDKADRMIGELSYPFYIYHLFALTMAEELQHRLWARLDVAWVGLAMTLILSVVTLAFESRYVEPLRARLSRRKESAAEGSELPAPVPGGTPVPLFTGSPIAAAVVGPVAAMAGAPMPSLGGASVAAFAGTPPVTLADSPVAALVDTPVIDSGIVS